MDEYLKTTEIIDWNHPAVLAKSREMAQDATTKSELARCCFEWVRDKIKHIVDHNIQTVTCTASEVLQDGSGICYAKSHLLAALLRANNIQSGFCYQRLSRDDNGAPYCLHGLNAVYLPDIGWFRIDCRGNKPGVNAQFSPPREQLAFSVELDGEIDFRTVLADPLPTVVKALTRFKTKNELWDNLPDAIALD